MSVQDAESERVLDLVRQEIARDRAERLQPRPVPTWRELAEQQDLKRAARQQATEQAEQARLQRVKQLAPKAKRMRRELEEAERAYADADAAFEQIRDARQQIDDTRRQLSNKLAHLEQGTDLDVSA
ncbi:hypothetical protein OJ997_27695 [Solirubrobacter phytolaccae]|uniref:Uncharacterized protein n=1 Tax=Solirubrobacter phytolaccae TaxID=1404360 RepID=A0A9X3NDJ0_9ACTN|nr:hypothetical protein [Solirubrobacter phytolaccae]MDA0184124.1 hypothetical protein [Solirubrobacter phytolaccae]